MLVFPKILIGAALPVVEPVGVVEKNRILAGKRKNPEMTIPRNLSGLSALNQKNCGSPRFLLCKLPKEPSLSGFLGPKGYL